MGRFTGVLLLLAHFGGGVSNAADAPDELLIRKGVEARRKLDDAAALELFKQAYALRASPRAAAQMGLAEIALGRWVEAEEHLAEAMAANNDPWVQKTRAVLEGAMIRVAREVGTLEVLGTPAGTEVVIGGEVRGKLPLAAPLHVRAGEIRIELRANGYGSESRTVTVQAGELSRETVALSKLPVSVPLIATAPTRTSSPGIPTVTATPETASHPALPGSDTGGALRAAGLIVGGAGIAVLGAGVAFGLEARSASTTDSQAPVYDPNAEPRGRRYVTFEWVGCTVGAALLIGGATTYFVGRARRHAPQVTFVPTPGGGVSSLAGTF